MNDINIDIPRHAFNFVPFLPVFQVVADARSEPLCRVRHKGDRLLTLVRGNHESLRIQHEVDDSVAYPLLEVQPQLRPPRGAKL